MCFSVFKKDIHFNPVPVPKVPSEIKVIKISAALGMRAKGDIRLLFCFFGGTPGVFFAAPKFSEKVRVNLMHQAII